MHAQAQTRPAAAPDPEAATPNPRVPPLERAWLWFSQAQRIDRARSAIPASSPDQVELRRRARLAFELAEQLEERGIPARSGAPSAAVAQLYLEGLYWSLLAARPDLGRPEAGVLWTESQALLDGLGFEPVLLGMVQEPFVARHSFVKIADLTPARQRGVLTAARNIAASLEDQYQAPTRALQALLVKRAASVLLLGATVVVLAAVALLLFMRKADLAHGKPWQASSARSTCHLERGECDGRPTRILFHTNEESDPWFEYDMVTPTRFSSMTIRNRSDEGFERALPLVIEVSADRKSYRQIALREKSFTVWTPKFAPQTARFIRLRVPRKTFFHLEKVQVHP